MVQKKLKKGRLGTSHISTNRCHGYLQIKTIKDIKFIKVDQRESKKKGIKMNNIPKDKQIESESCQPLRETSGQLHDRKLQHCQISHKFLIRYFQIFPQNILCFLMLLVSHNIHTHTHMYMRTCTHACRERVRERERERESVCVSLTQESKK